MLLQKAFQLDDIERNRDNRDRYSLASFCSFVTLVFSNVQNHAGRLQTERKGEMRRVAWALV